MSARIGTPWRSQIRHPRRRAGHGRRLRGITACATRSRDTLVVKAGEQSRNASRPNIVGKTPGHRRKEVWGEAFRRPGVYAAVADAPAREPFLRVDHEGRPARRA